jgi:Ni/Co efflux regulator RcnB
MIRVLVAAVLALAGAAAVAGDPAHFFAERHWTAVREFYNAQMRAGICPIGFAKKDDGCEPPRAPRKWAVGKSIPPGAIRFNLPNALAEKLGKPPTGHRYVRVGPDILLVSNRTKLVVGAIEDLGRR